MMLYKFIFYFVYFLRKNAVTKFIYVMLC